MNQRTLVGTRIDVLDKGYVRLVDFMGSDLSVVNAARASFAKESVEFGEKDERLLFYLLRHGHLSPLRHAFMTFEIKAPLMVARQLWKYIVGSDHTMDGWNEACLPGHQTVKAWSGRTYTVEQLYKLGKRQRNYLPYLRSVNDRGEVVRNKVAAVWEAGVADVYRVTSDNGFVIEATANHRFLTPDGYKMLSELSPGDLVMMNGEPAYKNKEWLRQKYVVEGLTQKEIASLVGCTDHTIRKWVRVHGLQQDPIARLHEYNRKYGVFGKGETAETNESIQRRTEKMRAKLKGRPAYARGPEHHAWKGDVATINAGHYRGRKVLKNKVCVYCGAPAEVHHIDGNPLNNSPENLKPVCSKHHHMEHGKHVLMVAHPVPIKSIEHVGRLKVYDIEMQHEPNLVVNQYIVHNSRRYITMEPEFYVPEFWRQAPENKKQGSGGPVSMELTEAFNRKLEEVIELGMRYYREALDAGIAPEQARLLLPAYGMYTVWRWSASLQSVLHFLSQRLADDAQWEIRQYAKAVNEFVAQLFPATHRAWLRTLTDDMKFE